MRIIKTNLPNEKKYCEMIASVVGQLSDGIWENSNRCIPYWMFAECDSGCKDIKVSDKYVSVELDNWYRNPYKKMTDEQIKKYFAKKIKEIVLIELEDNYKSELKSKFLKDLNRCIIPNDRYDEYKERYNQYKEYIKVNPFIKRGKFNIDNDMDLCYISYDERITVADCYKAYKILMN